LFKVIIMTTKLLTLFRACSNGGFLLESSSKTMSFPLNSRPLSLPLTLINRGFHSSQSTAKALNPPVFDHRNKDIDIDPDEIEYVGRKLRRFQKSATGIYDPLPSEVEPSPLHLVTMTRHFYGEIWWIKKILWEFGMYTHAQRKFPFYDRAIVPNTPANNKKLAKIKHLVRIDRVTFPYGYPESEDDLKHMRISEHGEVTFVREVDAETMDATTLENLPSVLREPIPEEMDEETIKRYCHEKYHRYREFLDEYHPEAENRMFGQNEFPGLKVYWKKDKQAVVY